LIGRGCGDGDGMQVGGRRKRRRQSVGCSRWALLLLLLLPVGCAALRQRLCVLLMHQAAAIVLLGQRMNRILPSCPLVWHLQPDHAADGLISTCSCIAVVTASDTNTRANATLDSCHARTDETPSHTLHRTGTTTARWEESRGGATTEQPKLMENCGRRGSFVSSSPHRISPA
jgi:hypothetical protein